MSKKAKRRNRCPKKRKPFLPKKTGTLKEKKPFKNHENASSDISCFIPKIKST
jgi:hypothetical protein